VTNKGHHIVVVITTNKEANKYYSSSMRVSVRISSYSQWD